MPTTSRRLRHLIALAIPTMLIVGGAIPVTAHDDDAPPRYLATVAPAQVPAGTSVSGSVQIKELTTVEYGIGSVRITAPTGYSLTGATAVVGSTSVPVTVGAGTATVENLSLRRAGQTLTISVTTSTACGVSGTVTWGVNARTSRSYTSTRGVDVSPDATSSLSSVVVPCSLDFLRQPALTGSGATITSVAADPSGASVAVRLLDGNGQPAAQAGVAVSVAIKSGTGSPSATLGGTTTDTTNANGVAAFAPTIGTPAFGYRLTADAGAGITGTNSAAFDIAGVAKVCSGACTGQDSKAGTTASIDASTTGGLLTLSLGLQDVDCNNAANNFYRASSEPLLFDVTQATGRVIVTVRINAASVDRKTNKYQVCFSSPVSTFVSRFGTTVTAGGAGLLPDCRRDDDDDDHDHDAKSAPKPLPVGYQACTEKRWKDSAGNVFVRFSVPPGDPRAKI